MPEFKRTPEAIAAELRTLRRQKSDLESKWEALRKEFIAALGPYLHEAGGVRVVFARKFKWKSSIVTYLVQTLGAEDRNKALRPVAEEIEKMYADGKVTLAGVKPHIDGIELGTRLFFPEDRKKTERAPSDKEQFRTMVEEYTEDKA